MRHLDFGNARRAAVGKDTPVGRRLADVGDPVASGKFFDDDLAADIFTEALSSEEGDATVVLDGFPRNRAQLHRLRAELDLQLAVVLEAPFETLLERTDGRLIHPPSGRTYHSKLLPPKVPMCDDLTGEPLVPRFISSEMSAEAALARRCEIEAAEIGPLVGDLEQEGLVARLDAGQPPEAVHAALLGALRARGISAGRQSGVVVPAVARAAYEEKGWVALEGVLDAGWVAALRAAVAEILAASASSTSSTAAFDVDVGHNAASPSLRKIKRPHLWHPAFAAVALEPRLLDAVEQLLGGRGVRWQGDKVVVKMPRVGQHVVCHQDWAFYPHTERVPLKISEHADGKRQGACADLKVPKGAPRRDRSADGCPSDP